MQAHHAKVGEEVGEADAARSDWAFMGVDPTPAPLGDASIGDAIERFTGAKFGASGTMTAAFAITSAVKAVKVKQIGYSGLMLPLMEDKLLAQRWAENTYDIDSVLAYSANLETLEGASAHPKTAVWWATQPEAWAASRANLQKPETAMRAYVEWIRGLEGKPVFVAYPAGFDFLFVYWYLIRFAGESPFSHSALDMKSYAMAVLKTGYRDSTKRNMPPQWFDDLPHTRVALDDAIEQGALFCNMLKANLEKG